MKKIFALIAVVFLAGGLFLSSCNSSKRLCPAYPPAPYHGDVQDMDNDNGFIQSEEAL